jgi:hypothetical protein
MERGYVAPMPNIVEVEKWSVRRKVGTWLAPIDNSDMRSLVGNGTQERHTCYG